MNLEANKLLAANHIFKKYIKLKFKYETFKLNNRSYSFFGQILTLI